MYMHSRIMHTLHINLTNRTQMSIFHIIRSFDESKSFLTDFRLFWLCFAQNLTVLLVWLNFEEKN